MTVQDAIAASPCGPAGKKIEWLGAALLALKAGKTADLWILGGAHGLPQMPGHNAKD